MSEDFQENENDSRFWEELDSLRDYLNEEEAPSPRQASRRSSARVAPQRRTRVRPPRQKVSAGSVVLTCFVFLEFAAVCGVAWSWYLWIH